MKKKELLEVLETLRECTDNQYTFGKLSIDIDKRISELKKETKK